MSKITTCKECKGKGYKWIPGKLYDYHKGLYTEATREICHKCLGSGRLIKEIRYIPYEESSTE